MMMYIYVVSFLLHMGEWVESQKTWVMFVLIQVQTIDELKLIKVVNNIYIYIYIYIYILNNNSK